MSYSDKRERALPSKGANNGAINNVPNEIWDHILGFVESEERAITSLNLSRTCKAIHYQTLELPSVGKTIHIFSTGQHNAIGEKDVRYVKYLLKMAGQTSLSWKLIEHSGDPMTHPQEFKAMDELLDLFFDRTEQWHAIDLSICASHERLKDTFNQIRQPLRLPQLRSARINIFESNNGAVLDEDEVWRALSCPTLTRVGTTYGSGSDNVPTNIPYRQLTCLILNGSSVDIQLAQVATLLSQSCPNIQDLGLNSIVYSERIAYDTVKLPNLKRLYVSEGGPNAVRNLLGIIRAPKLFDLRIKYYSAAFNARVEFQVLDSLADKCAVKTVYLNADARHKSLVEGLNGELTKVKLHASNDVELDIYMLLGL